MQGLNVLQNLYDNNIIWLQLYKTIRLITKMKTNLYDTVNRRPKKKEKEKLGGSPYRKLDIFQTLRLEQAGQLTNDIFPPPSLICF